jgi:hypothetical protein
MGIKSTYDIERQTAIAIIVNKIYNSTNKELEDILEQFEESHFRNYIVYDILPDDTDEFRVIRHTTDF